MGGMIFKLTCKASSFLLLEFYLNVPEPNVLQIWFNETKSSSIREIIYTKNIYTEKSISQK